MSLAIAEMLYDGIDWTPINLADKFVEVFKRDPRKGYAARFYDFLQNVNTGREFLEKINPDSDKSGAAMRAGPIGFLPDIRAVIDYAAVQAKLTHDTPIGIGSAVAAALMAHYFLYDYGKKSDLGRFIEAHVPGNWAEPWREEVKSQGCMHVRAAITAVMEEYSLSSVLMRSIDFGGDVDTVAAIAMASASCSKEIKKDIPGVLVSGLEDGRFGRSYLVGLDKMLIAEFLK